MRSPKSFQWIKHGICYLCVFFPLLTFGQGTTEISLNYEVALDEETGYSRLIAVTESGKHLLFDVNEEKCMNIIKVTDFNNDGYEDALIEIVNGCGGNCCGNSYQIITYDGNLFWATTEIGYDWDGIEINETSTGYEFVVETSYIGNVSAELCSNKVETYILNGLIFELVHVVADKKVKAKKEILAENYIEQEGEKIILHYDLDGDGDEDIISCDYSGSWAVFMNITVHFSKGGSTEIEGAGRRIGVLSSKSNKVKDLVIDCNEVFRWNGEKYVTDSIANSIVYKERTIEALNELALYSANISPVDLESIQQRTVKFYQKGVFWKYLLIIVLFWLYVVFLAFALDALISLKPRNYEVVPYWKALITWVIGGCFGYHHIYTGRNIRGAIYLFFFFALVVVNIPRIYIYFPYPQNFFSIPPNQFTFYGIILFAAFLLYDLIFLHYYTWAHNTDSFKNNSFVVDALNNRKTNDEDFKEELIRFLPKVNETLDDIDKYVGDESYIIRDENEDDSLWGSIKYLAKDLITGGGGSKLQAEKDRLRMLLACCEDLKSQITEMEDMNERLANILFMQRSGVVENLNLAKELIAIGKSQISSKEQKMIVDQKIEIDVYDKGIGMNSLSLSSVNPVFDSESFLDGISRDLSETSKQFNKKNFAPTKNDLIAYGIEAGISATINGISGIINLNMNTKAARVQVENQKMETIDFIAEANEQILNAHAYLGRHVEVLSALIEANKAFVHAYEPLREQIIGNGDFGNYIKTLKGMKESKEKFQSVEFIKDLQHLVLVCQEYNKINKATTNF